MKVPSKGWVVGFEKGLAKLGHFGAFLAAQWALSFQIFWASGSCWDRNPDVWQGGKDGERELSPFLRMKKTSN